MKAKKNRFIAVDTGEHMVSDDELREMMTIHRSDYHHCPVCSEVTHRHDTRCRWWGGKKIHIRRPGKPSRIFFTLFCLTLVFAPGHVTWGYLAGIPLIIVFSVLLSLLKRTRWLKWNVF